MTRSTVPNAVIAKIGDGGKVCIFTQATVDLVADLNGYYPDGSRFDAVQPARLLETRVGPGLSTFDGLFNGIGALPATSVTELQITGRADVPADADAVALNVTVADAQSPGIRDGLPVRNAPSECGEHQLRDPLHGSERRDREDR